jgi:hypothetical protein
LIGGGMYWGCGISPTDSRANDPSEEPGRVDGVTVGECTPAIGGGHTNGGEEGSGTGPCTLNGGMGCGGPGDAELRLQ